MNPLLKLGLGVAVVLGALSGAYMHGYSTAAARWKLIVQQNETANAEAKAAAVSAARADEQGAAKRQAKIAANQIEGLQNEINSRDRTIADLRSGAISLRKRFTCPAASAAGQSAAATSTGNGDATQAGGLQQQDAEFLVRLASEADEVTLQLQACQAVVRSDRQQAQQ
jgi:hypothetical protein